MSYIALYRKWRPQKFEQLVGQDHISKTLKNALSSNKLAHAYLLCGPRGTGKTTTAKIIAKAANCLEPQKGEPCNKCEICAAVNAGNLMDILEIDGASNRGIEEIRALKEKVNLSPSQGKYKIYIIDEVHMLTPEAFNALLKTLEEPPQYVIFIFATTEPHKLPPTILSRCQRFDFHRIGIETIVKQMEYICKESEISYDKDSLVVIARLAQGGMRDALSLMDQCLSYGEQKLDFEKVKEVLGIVATEYVHDIFKYLFLKDAKQVISKINVLINEGKDVRQLTEQCLDYLRNLLIYKICNDEVSDILSSEEKDFQKKHDGINVKKIHFVLECISQAESEMRWSSNPRLLLEAALFRYLLAEDNISCSNLQERVEALENQMKNKVNYSSSIDNSLGKKKEIIKEVPKEYDSKEKKNMAKVDIKGFENEDRPATAETEMHDIKKIWEALLEEVNKQKKSTKALLIEGNPKNLKDKCLEIEFSGDCRFHKEMVEQPENKKIIEKSLATIYGQKLNVVFALADDKNVQKEHPEDKNQVDCAHSIFGGSVVDLKK